jgi:hypothetical protein
MRRTDAVCPACERRKLDFYLATGEGYPRCECGAQMEWLPMRGNQHIVPDDIPGGYEIRHGLCNADGTPRRFYSHSDIRKAAAARGLTNYVERGVADKKDYDRLTRRV